MNTHTNPEAKEAQTMTNQQIADRLRVLQSRLNVHPAELLRLAKALEANIEATR